MSEFYKIIQGTMFEGHWVEPVFPLTKENVELNIKHGLAFERTENEAEAESSSPAWGSGIFEVLDNGEYTCLAENFDSSD